MGILKSNIKSKHPRKKYEYNPSFPFLAAALYNRDYVAEVVDAVRNITAPPRRRDLAHLRHYILTRWPPGFPNN
ncbi:MAG: hypothetical protein QXJ64_09665 [Thermosphaera sp.]